MGLQITGMTLKNLVRKPITRMYPVEPQVYTPLSRGHVENDIDKCILCGLCMRNCPGTALTVDKAARTWTINPFSCVQCKNCVRICPPKSLSMEPDYTPVAGEMSAITRTKPEEEQQEQQVSE